MISSRGALIGAIASPVSQSHARPAESFEGKTRVGYEYFWQRASALLHGWIGKIFVKDGVNPLNWRSILSGWVGWETNTVSLLFCDYDWALISRNSPAEI